jgi:hypothetical protein
VGKGKAKVKLSFPGWKEGKVAAETFQISTVDAPPLESEQPKDEAKAAEPVLRVGQPAPRLHLKALLQAPVEAPTTLDRLKGKAVVLEFWGTWCALALPRSPISITSRPSLCHTKRCHSKRCRTEQTNPRERHRRHDKLAGPRQGSRRLGRNCSRRRA